MVPLFRVAATLGLPFGLMQIDTRVSCPAFLLIGGMALFPGYLVCMSDYFSLCILRCIDLFFLIGLYAVCTY